MYVVSSGSQTRGKLYREFMMPMEEHSDHTKNEKNDFDL